MKFTWFYGFCVLEFSGGSSGEAREAQPPQNFDVKMGGGGLFNVNKIHNSFEFMSQNESRNCNVFVISQL